MKKKFLSIGMSLLLMFSVAACGGNDSSKANDAPKIERSLDAIATELELEKTTDKMAEFIGASEGAGYESETYGSGIEIYIYEDTDSDMYKGVVDGEDGYLSAAAANDGVVLIFSNGAEGDPELIEKFEALNFE